MTGAAATTNLSGVDRRSRSKGASSYYQAFPVPVRAADLNLPSVLKVPLIDGRWLNSADNELHLRSVVLGSGLAKQYGYLPGEIRTIRLNSTNFGVVGVLGPVALDPDLDNAAFVTQWAAKNDFGTDGKPNQLYVRADAGHHPGDRQRHPDRDQPGRARPGLHQGPERRAAGRVPGRTRPCSRWRCSPACWRWPSAGSASPTSCRSR